MDVDLFVGNIEQKTHKWRFKEAAPKSSVTGGVNTFPNKKGLVRCMTMIQNALDRYDLGQHFTYSWSHEKMRRKFFRAVWSQKLRQKMRIFKNFGASFWTSSQWIFSLFSFVTVLCLQIAFNFSYSHESMCARYVWCRRTFYIPITWRENASKSF